MSCDSRTLAGPTYLTTSPTNIYNQASGLITTDMRHIHLCNEGNTSSTASVYIGGSSGAVGETTLLHQQAVAANDIFDYWCQASLSNTNFVTAVCETGNSRMSIMIEGGLRAT